MFFSLMSLPIAAAGFKHWPLKCLSQAPQGLYLNVNFVSHLQIDRTPLSNVDSPAHFSDGPDSARIPFFRVRDPSAKPGLPSVLAVKRERSISQVALTFHSFEIVRKLAYGLGEYVTYSPRPYPAVLLTTRTDVATPFGSPHKSPLMQPVTVPGELPFIVSLRFSKAKVKLPLGGAIWHRRKQARVRIRVATTIQCFFDLLDLPNFPWEPFIAL